MKHPLDFVKFYAGLNLVHLVGSDVERAHQHGLAIQARPRQDFNTEPHSDLALDSLSKKNQTLIARALEAGILKPLSKIASVSAYETLVQLGLVPQLDPQKRRELDAMLSAAGIPLKKGYLALFQPDLLMILAAFAHPKKAAFFLEGAPGCTSGITLRNQSQPLLFARNLDYPAASLWEKWTAVFYHEPTEHQRYVHVATLGVHPAGLTGFNESGIAFSLHAQFSRKVRLTGQPIFFLGDALMQNATSIESAIQILRSFPTLGNWTFNIASRSENRAVSVELSEGKSFIRETGGHSWIGHSNGFQNPIFQKNEIQFSEASQNDVQIRKAEMDRVLKSFQESPRPREELIAALAATLAGMSALPNESVHVFGNSISSITTIQSVILDLDQNQLWVSNRMESPTGLGPYVGLPFSWQDFPKDFNEFDLPQLNLPGGPSTDYQEALHHYHQAYVSWQVQNRSELDTLPHLIEAARLQPRDPHVRMQQGYFELKTGKYSEASQSFAATIDWLPNNPQPSHLKAVATYFLGFALDCVGNRESAIQAYQQVKIHIPNADLAKKVARRLKKPASRMDCQKISPDLQFVEPIDYP